MLYSKGFFRDKKDLLSLYNAIHGTNYDNPDDLEITTLEDAIYMSYKNDLSFIIAATLSLYEHQSSVNPNMPLRGLIYFARLYEAYIKKTKQDIYGSAKVRLPFPEYIVFYNGSHEIPDVMEIKLSDLFIPTKDIETPSLECTAKVININYGHNVEILDTCEKLRGYSILIAKINKFRAMGHSLKDSIGLAIDECIEEGVLVDILLKQKSEVANMLLTEYDQKLHEKTLREEGRAEGRKEGRNEGISLMMQLNNCLIADNRMDDLIKASKDKKFQEKLLKEYGIK